MIVHLLPQSRSFTKNGTSNEFGDVIICLKDHCDRWTPRVEVNERLAVEDAVQSEVVKRVEENYAPDGNNKRDHG
jgi:hypothetical protein